MRSCDFVLRVEPQNVKALFRKAKVLLVSVSFLLTDAPSRVVRIELLHFVAGCHTRSLNQAVSVLSLSLDFLNVSIELLTRATFYVVLFVC